MKLTVQLQQIVKSQLLVRNNRKTGTLASEIPSKIRF